MCRIAVTTCVVVWIEIFEEMMAILDNEVLGPNEYIVITCKSGLRLACRKGDIVGLGEYIED